MRFEARCILGLNAFAWIDLSRGIFSRINFPDAVFPSAVISRTDDKSTALKFHRMRTHPNNAIFSVICRSQNKQLMIITEILSVFTRRACGWWIATCLTRMSQIVVISLPRGLWKAFSISVLECAFWNGMRIAFGFEVKVDWRWIIGGKWSKFSNALHTISHSLKLAN